MRSPSLRRSTAIKKMICSVSWRRIGTSFELSMRISIAGRYSTHTTHDTPETVTARADSAAATLYRDNHDKKGARYGRTNTRHACSRTNRRMEARILERLGHAVSGILQRQRLPMDCHCRRHGCGNLGKRAKLSECLCGNLVRGALRLVLS